MLCRALPPLGGSISRSMLRVLHSVSQNAKIVEIIDGPGPHFFNSDGAAGKTYRGIGDRYQVELQELAGFPVPRIKPFRRACARRRCQTYITTASTFLRTPYLLPPLTPGSMVKLLLFWGRLVRTVTDAAGSQSRAISTGMTIIPCTTYFNFVVYRKFDFEKLSVDAQRLE